MEVTWWHAVLIASRPLLLLSLAGAASMYVRVRVRVRVRMRLRVRVHVRVRVHSVWSCVPWPIPVCAVWGCATWLMDRVEKSCSLSPSPHVSRHSYVSCDEWLQYSSHLSACVGVHPYVSRIHICHVIFASAHIHICDVIRVCVIWHVDGVLDGVLESSHSMPQESFTWVIHVFHSHVWCHGCLSLHSYVWCDKCTEYWSHLRTCFRAHSHVSHHPCLIPRVCVSLYVCHVIYMCDWWMQHLSHLRTCFRAHSNVPHIQMCHVIHVLAHMYVCHVVYMCGWCMQYWSHLWAAQRVWAPQSRGHRVLDRHCRQVQAHSHAYQKTNWWGLRQN